jgi:hypothetical protein
MRLGKREREMRREAFKVRSGIIANNVANMAAIKEEARLTGLRSSANPTLLKSSTKYGYRDNLHGKAAKVNNGSCRVDK